MPRLLIAVFCILFSVIGASAQDWQARFDSLLGVSPGAERDSLIAQIVSSKPAWQEVVTKIESLAFPNRTKGQALLDSTTCIDGVTRPYVIYVPSSYDPKTPTPMLVFLHGLVSRPNIMANPKEEVEKDTLTILAEKRGWILLFPMGQAGATWWDEVGMTNVLNLVRLAKINFNIDDDRVCLSGFSDGGSAAFLFAMVLPTDFGAFVALNGHMGVGSEDGDLPTYATNMFNSNIFATTTDRDGLYPTSIMERTISLAEKAGARILYRKLKGEHRFGDVEGELPAIFDFLEQHPRNSLPDTIIWETAVAGFGVCKWLAIDQVTIDEPAPWYTDYNLAMVDSSLSIGFIPADTFPGPGVMVASVVKEDKLASRIGLQPGDIIVKGNGTDIADINGLNLFKTTLRHGAEASLTVLRGEKEVILSGRVPAPRNYFLFNRTQPSAVIRAEFNDNKFDLQGSRVGAFRILINPRMINLNQNVTVTFDGKKIFDAKVEPDIEYLIRDYLSNRDRKLVFVNELRLHPPNTP